VVVVDDGGRGRVNDVVIVVGERFDVRGHGCVLFDEMKSLNSVLYVFTLSVANFGVVYWMDGE